MDQDRPEAAQLPRLLDGRHAASMVVGIIIGSGIFLVPREMAAATGRTSVTMLAWLVGGLLSLFGAMSYAEVAAMRPRVGGEYAFLHDAYGPMTAFLYTWTWMTVAKPASLATLAVGLLRVLGTFPMLAFLPQPAFLSLRWSQVMALIVLWAITALNILSTRIAGALQGWLTVLKVLLILAIAGLCFWGLHTGGPAAWNTLQSHFELAQGGLSGFVVALIATLWAYDGWSDVSQMAGEVRDPQRAMPRALIAGTALVGVLYMLVTLGISIVLPTARLASTDRPAAEALRLTVGHAGASIVAVGMAVSIAATFLGSSLSGARVPFAAAADGLLPTGLAAVHPRYKTPWRSLLLQSALASVLVLAVGRFQALFSLAIVSEWLFYALTAATVFVFRRREPDAVRPYRVNGYPLVPALFIAAAIGLLGFTSITQPRLSAAGAGVILLGVPVYVLLARRRVVA